MATVGRDHGCGQLPVTAETFEDAGFKTLSVCCSSQISPTRRRRWPKRGCVGGLSQHMDQTRRCDSILSLPCIPLEAWDLSCHLKLAQGSRKCVQQLIKGMEL